MDLALVVGARPNFVKAAAILGALHRRGAVAALIHTGQHSDPGLSDSFFQQLDLPRPLRSLDIQGTSRGEQFGEMVRALSLVLPELGVQELIVVGDVTSTAAAAIAADCYDIAVAHVEAGLRSFDSRMPEERNRRVVDVLARRHFVTEPAGVANLRAEGVPAERIHLVGNVMIDTLARFRDLARERAPWLSHGVSPGRYALASLHRPSNVDEPLALSESLELLSTVANRMPILFTLHPRTRERLRRYHLHVPERVRLLPPLDYIDFIGLMSGARVLLTDSGGAQEESSVLGIPCLTLRDNTERPITVERGSSRLVGRSARRVCEHLDEIDSGEFDVGGEIPLWDGKAGDRIADILLARAA